ncbi:MAG: P-II family nitrogen regulator [Syntrophomonas sp.]
MKRIEAVIRPSKLNDLMAALDEIGIKEINIFDVKGRGLQGAQKHFYRGQVHNNDLFNKVKVEFNCPNEAVDTIVNTILKACQTGKIGDGKIFVYPLEDILTI